MDSKISLLCLTIIIGTLAELRTDSFCEYDSLNISCELSHIRVINATFGREGNKCGHSRRGSCPVTDVTAAVTRKCDDSLVCRFEIDDDFFGIINENCGHEKRLNVTYDCYGNINQIGSWDVALANCSSSGRNLTSINELNSSEINDEKGTWLRERWQYTDFYWIEGCYNITGTINNATFKLNSNNGLYQCQKHCNDSLYIGLMDKTCFCVYDNLGTVPSDNGNCSLTCQGNQMDICGNVNTVTRYRKYKGTLNIKGERDYNKNCVYILNVNSKIYELYEDCESKNVDGYICMKYSTNSGQIIQTVYENQLSWTEARRKCKANQEDLSSFFKEVPIGNLIENNRYWIGLYRSRNIIYNETTNSDNVACGTLRPDLIPPIYYVACNENRSFHCIKDISVTSTKATIITTHHTTSTNVSIPVDNSNTIKAGLIGGALGLSVVLVLVCFGVCLGCFRFHNRKRPIKRRKLTQSTSNKMSEGDDDVFIVPESDKDIKPKSYPPPVKPARRRSSAARVSYENVPLVEYKESETMKDKTHSDNLRKDNVVVAVEISTDSNAPKLETSASNISLPGDILGNSVYDYASQVENKSIKPNLEEVHSYEMVNNEAEYVTTADDVYDIMNEKRPKNPEKITENIYDQTSCDLYDSTIKQGSVTLDSQYDSTTAFKHQLM